MGQQEEKRFKPIGGDTVPVPREGQHDRFKMVRYDHVTGTVIKGRAGRRNILSRMLDKISI